MATSQKHVGNDLHPSRRVDLRHEQQLVFSGGSYAEPLTALAEDTLLLRIFLGHADWSYRLVTSDANVLLSAHIHGMFYMPHHVFGGGWPGGIVDIE